MTIQPSWLELYNTLTLSLQRGKTLSPNGYPEYDTEPFDGKVSVLELCGMWSTPSLPLLPGPR